MNKKLQQFIYKKRNGIELVFVFGNAEQYAEKRVFISNEALDVAVENRIDLNDFAKEIGLL